MISTLPDPIASNCNQMNLSGILVSASVEKSRVKGEYLVRADHELQLEIDLILVSIPYTYMPLNVYDIN